MIEPELLPRRALIDTGVVIRWLGQQTDQDADACRAFVEAMIKVGNDVYIAAPTLVEVMRAESAPQVPRRSHVIVGGFDEQAAVILAEKFPMEVIRSAANSNGYPVSYMKYDAMIAACAIRYGAEAIVALDGDHVQLARGTSLRVAHPRDFEAQQGELGL